MPKARPNTMNNYGLMLNELGMSKSFLDGLLLDAIRPIAAVLFPERGGASLDHHHAFTVRYSPEGDKDLSLHYDDAEVTLNVSLGKQFTGTVSSRECERVLIVTFNCRRSIGVFSSQNPTGPCTYRLFFQ